MSSRTSGLRLPRIGELNIDANFRIRSDAPALDVGVEAEFSGQFDADVKIEPVGTAVYAAGVQTGGGITHRIWLRRPIKRLTRFHEVVAEGCIYRVLRSADVNGQIRFTVLEVEELGEEGGAYG